MPANPPQRVTLAQLPTPLMQPTRLCRELDDAQLWFKRDDLSGLELSGNKIRKLEFVLAAARADGVDTIVTEGTPQSNHCRATAAACARLGLHCVLLFRPAHEPRALPAGNHLLDVLYGATCRGYAAAEFEARRDEIVAEVLEDLHRHGRRPRYTPSGASEPLGCWGYITAAAELAAQLRERQLGPCDVIVPLSSGGTYAGMLLGQQLHGLDEWNLWAVPVSDDVDHQRAAILELTRRTVQEFGLPVEPGEADLQFIDGYVGEGYAIPYAQDIATVRHVARMEGILLDPVYTGKACCALLDGIRAGRFGRERPVIHLLTGGLFSNFAWPELLLGT